MGRRTGAPATRSLVGGNSANNIGGDIERGRISAPAPTLQRAIVIDVIIDPNMLTAEQTEGIANTVSNPRFAHVMPTNAIIARIVSNEGGQAARTNTILFPFFSSHFLLPIQPGEMVEVIYDDYSHGGQQLGYWLTRTSMQRTIEDVNYTHADRRFLPGNNPANFTTEERANRSSTQPDPGFPNGGNTTTTLTLPQSGSNNAYNQVLNNATGHLGLDSDGQVETIPLQTFEVVPRWRKRPQELVLQGANNTIMVFGEDRKGGPLGKRDEETPDASGAAGTIDIIVGRGRIIPANDADPNQDFPNTAAWSTENTRGSSETDKARYMTLPGTNALSDNLTEGDPDFVRDAARFYITMQSEADVNFGITEIEFTEDTLPGDEIPQPNAGTLGTLNKSYIVGKADHLRLIARKDEDNNVEGTILLLREGEAEEDLDVIYMSADGIHIDAPKIVLGRGLGDLASAGSDPTPGGEPYIRWSKFRDAVDSLHDEMDTMRTEYKDTFDNLNTTVRTLITALQTSAGTSVCAPFSPDPAFTSLLPQLGPLLLRNIPTDVTTPREIAGPQLDNQNTATNDAVEAAQSEKIFGE